MDWTTIGKNTTKCSCTKITGTNNSIYQERYLTVSVHKRSIDDARTYFARIGTDIVTHLAKLSSTAEGLDAESRLQIHGASSREMSHRHFRLI